MNRSQWRKIENLPLNSCNCTAIVISKALVSLFLCVVSARSANDPSVPLAAALIIRFTLKSFPHLNSHSSQWHFTKKEHQNDPIIIISIQCSLKNNCLSHDNINAFSFFHCIGLNRTLNTVFKHCTMANCLFPSYLKETQAIIYCSS